ncbi:hypothetical protein [Robertkochia sediminum]|uniref:hypothetical protein n=1 Tax=Robertkochia sediminum TaxID=2785326 RepID=UPI0019331797|nr:hypothetical protein [Robertkochia sediminum]MBL7472629.1 hypothetical protein [Robertkochia sediminum]
MAQDIRKLLKEDGAKPAGAMPKGHRERFEALLEEELPQNEKGHSFFWMRIAAGFLLVLAAGVFVYFQQAGPVIDAGNGVAGTEGSTGEKVTEITLGDLSPDLGKIENYYLASINMELASIEMSEETKQLVSGYMSRLSELDDEYQALTRELNEIGPNQQTVDALIDNLQLRLDLLYRLKNQLQELKQEENETINMQTI